MKHLWIKGSTKKDKGEAPSPFPLPIGERIKERGRIKIYKHGIWFILMPILLLSLFSQIAIAQDEAAMPQVKRPYKLPPNLLQYFKGKYVHIDDFLTSNVQETPNGPLGNLGLRGNIKPTAEIQGETREERARAIAMAFIREEAALFDISNIEEIRERKIKTDRGYGGEYTHLYYDRYIGGLLFGYDIHITIGPDETITHVGASLVPTPPELYQAVTKETISKEQVIKIVERVFGAPKRATVKVLKVAKFATWRPPYVIWTAHASVFIDSVYASAADCAFTINAFTGDILSRIDARRYLTYDPNRKSLCD